jgi:nitroreductase
MGEAPALVLFLLPVIAWAPADDEGAMDIGPLYASIYPAVQNFCVAARALGLGTALTTVVRIHTDDVLAALGVPTGFEIAALVPVGRPSGHFGQARRRPVEAVTHWNHWGARERPA